MQAYSIRYSYKIKGKETPDKDALVDAKSLKSAKNKLMRKHNVKRLTIKDAKIIGYFKIDRQPYIAYNTYYWR